MQHFSKIATIAVLFLIFAVSCDVAKDNANKPTSDIVKVYVTSASESQNAYVDAYCYDKNNVFLSTAVITVDGIAVPKDSTYNVYYVSLGTPWISGASHTFHVETPNGGVYDGTISRPGDTVSGATFSPSSGVSDTYTVSAPSGGWPTDSEVYLTAIVGSSSYGAVSHPTGNSTTTFAYPGLPFLNPASPPSSVSFATYINKKTVLAGFGTNSFAAVSGTKTSW